MFLGPLDLSYGKFSNFHILGHLAHVQLRKYTDDSLRGLAGQNQS